MNLIGTMNNSKFNIIHINCFLQQVCQLARAVFGWGTWGSYEIGGGCAQLCTVAGARIGWADSHVKRINHKLTITEDGSGGIEAFRICNFQTNP